MSFDLRFIRVRGSEPLEETAARDSAHADDTAVLEQHELQTWDAARDAVSPLLSHPEESATDTSRGLDEEESGLRLGLCHGEFWVSVPYWSTGSEAEATIGRLRAIAQAVEGATGLVAFDPQAGQRFLDGGERSAAGRFEAAAAVLSDRTEGTMPNYGYSTNWAGLSPLAGSRQTQRRWLRRMLARMNGRKRWCFSVWPAPPGMQVDEMGEEDWPRTFLQAAGFGRRMTLEVRYGPRDGLEGQYVVGRPAGECIGTPSEAIDWGSAPQMVYPHEVFDADTAADVFDGYVRTGRVPEEYPVRRLDFSAYES